MKEQAPLPADGPAPRPMPGWLWWPSVAALFVWQGWLTLGLFGPYPHADLFNDQPIVSGAYSQHLYLATIGSSSICTHGRSTVYDPAFQVGYLKTPIFDGSRMGEIFLLFGGGVYDPRAYKLGVAAACASVPLFFLLACGGAGLTRSASLIATLLGQLVWWGPLGRRALDAGDSEIYFAALASLAHVGLLIAFHRHAGIFAWFGLLATATLGWFFQPLLFPIALPLLLAYYLSVGTRHDFLTWHVAFWLAEVGAVLINLPWLIDWGSYWWLRTPLPSANALLEQRTLAGLSNEAIWGSAADRTLALVLVVSALVGIVILNQTHQRPAARLFGLGAFGALPLALLGVAWEPLGVVGTAGLLAPALWYAAVPAAHAWTCLVRWLWRSGTFGKVGALGLSGPILLFVGVRLDAECLLGRCVLARPLTVGLSAERQAVVDVLSRTTTPQARILWEDRAMLRTDSRWAALLPILTDRAFVGGLDPHGVIEHSSLCLREQTLAGRPFPSSTWTDSDLADYCRRYNIAWIVAWSPEVRKRFRQWNGVEAIANLRDGEDGVLFRVKEPSLNFALRGQAELRHADSHQILLANVNPDKDGTVVISLHYQTGLHASPSRVQIEREPSGHDQIDFVRLRLAVPAARVTLTWNR